MRRQWHAGVMTVALGAVSVASCSDATAPLPTGPRWALVSINGNALPTKPAGFTYTVLADTLQFGVTSPRWKPKPLAVATRYVIDFDNSRRTEEWWYTYDSSEPLPSPFAVRLLCGDGDQNSIIDCLNGNGSATLESDGMTIRFEEPIFGVLRYQRVP